jgi:DNA-binding CsgD family transcriptional regulator
MAEQPPGGLAAAVAVARIASGAGSVEQRAEELLASLQRLLPCDAAAVHVFDPQRNKFMAVASTGYDEPTQHYMRSAAFGKDVESVGLSRLRQPLSSDNLPIPRTELRGWTEFIEPSGLRDGVGVGLFYPDGRQLGLLTTHSQSRLPSTEAACDLLGRLAPTLANAVDPTRNATTLTRTVADATAGIVRTRASGAAPLPGLPSHQLFDQGSPLLTMIDHRLADGEAWISFLWPWATDDAVAGHLRITAFACPAESPYFITGVVLVSPAGDLHGLTARELEILGLIVTGWPNRRMATSLFITERTVAAHVEHILSKLGVASRTLAAVLAERSGLYVPRVPRPV